MASGKHLIRARVAVSTKGFPETVGKAKRRAILLKSVTAAAKVTSAAMKARAPRRKKSGALKKSIGTKSVRGKRWSAYAVVGPRKKVVKQLTIGKRTVKVVPANYAHVIEEGARPHSLHRGARLKRKDRPSSVEKFQDVGKQHPGVMAKPFIRPAMESSWAEANAAARRVLSAELARIIAEESAKLR